MKEMKPFSFRLVCSSPTSSWKLCAFIFPSSFKLQDPFYCLKTQRQRKRHRISSQQSTPCTSTEKVHIYTRKSVGISSLLAHPKTCNRQWYTNHPKQTQKICKWDLFSNTISGRQAQALSWSHPGISAIKTKKYYYYIHAKLQDLSSILQIEDKQQTHGLSHTPKSAQRMYTFTHEELQDLVSNHTHQRHAHRQSKVGVGLLHQHAGSTRSLS